MTTLVIIPTYNERENLAPLLSRICDLTSAELEILVVDDNSPDGTGEIADQLARDNPRVHVLHRAGKQGLASAYVAGFSWGLERSFDALVEMDADFSHDPERLPDMLATLAQSDVAVGSRYVPGGGTRNWGLFRRLLSRGGSLYARTILGAPINDFTGGFNGWHRRVLETIALANLRTQGYAFQIELKYRAWQHGFSIREFPITFIDRRVGKSKMSKKIVFEALYRVWLLRLSSNPAK